jgi:hypothetical protein
MKYNDEGILKLWVDRMKSIIPYLFLMFIYFLGLPSFGAKHERDTDASVLNKSYTVIESQIAQSASKLTSAPPSISWSKNNNGSAIANVDLKNKQVSIPFTTDEINAAARGNITPKTAKKINKLLLSNPGGGGPLP